MFLIFESELKIFFFVHPS